MSKINLSLTLLLVHGVISCSAGIALLVGIAVTGNMWFGSLILAVMLWTYLGFYIFDRVEFGPFSVRHREMVTLWAILSVVSIILSLIVYALFGPGLFYVISFFLSLCVQSAHPPFER